MSQKSQMNRILRKIYARELDLIEDTPLVVIKRKKPLRALKDALWVQQSTAIKIAIAALTLAFISAAVYYFNFFTINSYEVKMERAHIEAQLQRRNDLIPNLVTAVNNYALYEKNIFIHAADVRAAVKSIEEQIEQAGGEPTANMSFLSKFQAVAEAYPALKASEAYQTLMSELSSTETMIADMRINYNQVANFYNSRLKMFPGNIFSLMFGFEPVETFESETAAKSAPRVK
jgi:LemA protein